MERLTGLAPDDAVEQRLLWVWMVSIWKTQFGSVKNANQSNSDIPNMTRASHVDKTKTPRLFLDTFVAQSGYFAWAARLRRASAFYFFQLSSQPWWRGGIQNNGFCGDTAGVFFLEACCESLAGKATVGLLWWLLLNKCEGSAALITPEAQCPGLSIWSSSCQGDASNRNRGHPCIGMFRPAWDDLSLRGATCVSQEAK